MKCTNLIKSQQGCAFEKYVTALFIALADPKIEPFHSNSHSQNYSNQNRRIYDLYFPKGLKATGFPDNSFLEIKPRFNIRNVNQFTAQFLKENPNGFLYLIVDEEASEIPQAYREPREGQIHVLGRDFLTQFQNVAKTERALYLHATDQLVPKNFLTLEDFQHYQDKVLDQIKATLKEDDCAVLLGNGVSISVGSESWASLDKRLWRLLKGKITNPKVARSIVGNTSYSGTLLVHYSCIRTSKEKQYYRAIYQALYRRAVLPAASGQLMHGTAVFVKKYRPLVLTFNYDDLFERELQTYPSTTVQSFWENQPSSFPVSDISVIHVHGFLPSPLASITKAMKESIVLDEEDYYNFYIETDEWRRNILEETLKTKTCLLIGLSLSDTFLRNCFRASNVHNHYAFLCSRGLATFDDLVVLTSIFFDMNIDVIWKNTFKDISSLLLLL
jgi:hypothetical protein